jgi:molybdenum transport protein
MNFYISDSEIEKILDEDISTVDLTSFVLGLTDKTAAITFRARNLTMISAVEEVVRMLKKLDIEVLTYKPSGTVVQPGEAFIQAQGLSTQIQIVWRTCSKILEYFSGVATRTHHFVSQAREINPDITIAITRKNIPGTKKLAIKSILCGGAVPHRLGLSETILIFNEHIQSIGGLDSFLTQLPQIKLKVIEKKIGVEAQTYEDGLKCVQSGVDFVQLDKFSPAVTKNFVKDAKNINQNVIVVATGNINIDNLKEYAQTGVNVINTSSVYHGKPADIKAEIIPNN